MTERCLVHGTELHFDMRSGFDLCYKCEANKPAGQPTAAPEGREQLAREYVRDNVIGHRDDPQEDAREAYLEGYSAGKASGDAEPDWHTFYTDSQTKLYHADELLASAAEREKRVRGELARVSGIAQTLHTLLHPADGMEDCKLAPCDQFKNAAEYEKFASQDAELERQQDVNSRLLAELRIVRQKESALRHGLASAAEREKGLREALTKIIWAKSWAQAELIATAALSEVSAEQG